MYVGIRAVSSISRINFTRQVVRCHQNSARRRKVVDPGIQNRKTLLNSEQEMEQLNDYEFDLEADFMNLGKTYEEHMREVKLHKEKEKYLIVKQKYFKEKLPNFLTWSDKQQIRYLHNTNPEEWNIQKLSEGFPASPEVIMKIVKSTWTKKSDHQIQNHDQSVQKNWTLFKEKKLIDLPADVVEHLSKFSGRELNFKPFEAPEEMELERNKSMLSPNIKMGTEFSEIIKSYERLKNANGKTTEKLHIKNKDKFQKPPKEDTYVIGGSNVTHYSRHTTLTNLQNKILKKAEQGDLLADEKLLLQDMQGKAEEHHQSEEKSLKLIDSNDKTEVVPNKYTISRKVITKVRKPTNDYQLLEYPEKITIPKDKLKPGYTYKLNDCYYDDDGEFLYRVPGMYK